MAAKAPVTPVDALLDFGKEAEPKPERGPKPVVRKPPVPRKGPLQVPGLAAAYSTITNARPDGKPLPKTAYFTAEEWDRLARAVHHLGGIPAGGFVRYGALYLLERLEEANEGTFPPIPGR